MADKATNTEETTPAKRTRPESIKRVGADFNTEEYAVLRELRFVGRHDKDSDVVKAAVAAYADSLGVTTL